LAHFSGKHPASRSSTCDRVLAHPVPDRQAAEAIRDCLGSPVAHAAPFCCRARRVYQQVRRPANVPGAACGRRRSSSSSIATRPPSCSPARGARA
jgi:hypothetical protein